MCRALVGASRIAEQHVLGAIRETGGEAAIVVSTTEARARDFAAQNGIAAFDISLDRVLRDAAIGAVCISSTNEEHHAQAMAAIAAGKHLLCESPLP